MIIRSLLQQTKVIVESPKLAIVIIGVLGLLTALFSKRPEVFHAWWFIGLAVLLIINTLACSIRQARTARRTWRLQRRGQRAVQFSLDKGDEPEKYLLWAKQTLNGAGFNTWYGEGIELVILANKRAWANWGSVIFHFGLIICMVGALMSFTIGFKGKIGLTERSFFEDKQGQYGYIAPKPLTLTGGFNRFSLYLQQITVKDKVNGTWSEGKVTVFRQDVKVKEGPVSSGFPLRYRNLSISDDSFGYFIVLNLTDTQGRTEKLTVGIDTTKHAASEQYNADMELRTQNVYGRIELYPDFVDRAGAAYTRSYRMDNPVLKLELKDKSSAKIYQGNLAKGQEVTLADSRKLRFEGYYPWKSFWIIYDYGIPFIYSGFAIAGIGLLLLYALTCRQVRVIGGETEVGFQIAIEGWTPRFPKTYLVYLSDLLSLERFREGKAH